MKNEEKKVKATEEIKSEENGVQLTEEELAKVFGGGQNTEAVVKEDEKIAEFGRCR